MLYCTRATCQKPRLEGKWFCNDCQKTETILKESTMQNVQLNAAFTLKIIDVMENTFMSCVHPYAKLKAEESNWCNVCGAVSLDGVTWVKPHWRDILVAGVMKIRETLSRNNNSGV